MDKSSSSQNYLRLEKRLVLLNWLHSQLGFRDTTELLNTVEPTDEGFAIDGHSHIFNLLASRSRLLAGMFDIEDLRRYDDNIRVHLFAMNSRRSEPLTLRYFQYLAALYTEIYLDLLHRSPRELLSSLNQFVNHHNANRISSDHFTSFLSSDLHKLAFWMATGSGKTLLLHLNYRQFLHYSKIYSSKKLDNILLITPNEGLTKQHILDLQESNIHAKRFDLNNHGSLDNTVSTINVLEITKLVLEKRGEGDSVPVERFEGNNLIFVDEGHKGHGGEAWRKVRDAISNTGFTFEYSATFGQALSSSKDNSLVTEYGKAIIFDYSYRYFYDDGYGKDFQILNLSEARDTNWVDMLLLANLLLFYQKKIYFKENKQNLRKYNIESPLWVFIGSKVNAVFQAEKMKRSDVLTVVRFLHRVLSEESWCIDGINCLIKGESGLTNPDTDTDIFLNVFDYLNTRNDSPSFIYQDVLAKVFHGTSGGLHISDIRRADGELGLRAAGGESHFGVINIGDKGEFKKLVRASELEIVIEDEVVIDSLFDRINESGSTVEVLVGSRKFIEGWNSWRVSNMGLLNIGRGEGSQIIQLFGRGVRLKGWDMSLKRSHAVQGITVPNHIALLETLHIFAIRADYMLKFREYLEGEGVLTTEYITLTLPIHTQDEHLKKGLVIPRLPLGREFATDETIMLEVSEHVLSPVTVDISTKVARIDSSYGQHESTMANTGKVLTIPPEYLDAIDWNEVYLALLNHKTERKISNLIINPTSLRKIIQTQGEKNIYQLIGDPAQIDIRTPSNIRLLMEVIITILRKYADVLYTRKRLHWESKNLKYRTLDNKDLNFRFNARDHRTIGHYIVSVPRAKPDLAKKIEELIATVSKLNDNESKALPSIHFDSHLYQPLLLDNPSIKISPVGLNEGERAFIEDLRTYCSDNSNSLPTDSRLYVLRNLTRGKGVGFFEGRGFFPDFILWVKSKGTQRIVFVEPHGMIYESYYDQNPKLRLHESLAELASSMDPPSTNEQISLDSFIVSTTPYHMLKDSTFHSWDRKKFTANHIEFLPSIDGVSRECNEHTDDYFGYLRRILSG